MHMAIGILAFGSLRVDAGTELEPLIVARLPWSTPFGVEFARRSRTRGDAPTLVPFADADSVMAEVLVLRDDVDDDNARERLWRREVHRVGSGQRRPESSLVVFREFVDVPGCSLVLATDFDDARLTNLDSETLAAFAIASVAAAPAGRDGITYLRDALGCGVVTRRTFAYCDAILARTGTTTLDDALAVVREHG